LQFFSLKKKVKMFVAYTWESETKSGTGNSVLVMNKMPNSWEDMVAIKKNIIEWNLKEYPDASVMVIHYCEMK